MCYISYDTCFCYIGLLSKGYFVHTREVLYGEDQRRSRKMSGSIQFGPLSGMSRSRLQNSLLFWREGKSKAAFASWECLWPSIRYKMETKKCVGGKATHQSLLSRFLFHHRAFGPIDSNVDRNGAKNDHANSRRPFEGGEIIELKRYFISNKKVEL